MIQRDWSSAELSIADVKRAVLVYLKLRAQNDLPDVTAEELAALEVSLRNGQILDGLVVGSGAEPTAAELKPLFHEDLAPYSSHLPALWNALNASTGAIVEFGMGLGSTPALCAFSKMAMRPLLSFETEEKFFRAHVCSNPLHRKRLEGAYAFAEEPLSEFPHFGVLFIDHVTERRALEIEKYASRSLIVVAHDWGFQEAFGYGRIRDRFDSVDVYEMPNMPSTAVLRGWRG